MIRNHIYENVDYLSTIFAYSMYLALTLLYNNLEESYNGSTCAGTSSGPSIIIDE